MKRLEHIFKICPILYILAVLNLACPVFAGQQATQAVTARKNEGGGCSTLYSQETGGSNALFGYDTAIDRIYISSSYQAISSDPVKTIYVSLKRNGAALQTVTLYMCPDNGSGHADIDANCTVADATLSAVDFGTDYSYQKYNITAGFAQVSTTTYWIKLKALNVSSSQYPILEYYSTGSNTLEHSPDDSSWTTYDTSSEIRLILKACVE